MIESADTKSILYAQWQMEYHRCLCRGEKPPSKEQFRKEHPEIGEERLIGRAMLKTETPVGTEAHKRRYREWAATGASDFVPR